MKPSPLQLKRYFLTEICMTATPYFDPQKDHRYEFNNLQNSVDIKKDGHHPLAWQVILALKYIPKPNENVPYGFNLKIDGFFQVDPKWPQSKVETLVNINAPAVLYGAAREILAQVTSRGPWGPLLLPAVNFIPEKKPINLNNF